MGHRKSRYNKNMARGWESKSVEEQMAAGAPVFTPGEADRRRQQASQASRARQVQALELQRENILSQRTSNPNRRAALEAALAHIESQLKALE
jgi:hypothetical protein